ncbi:MAG TPA: SPFH domain-containing protein [Candidatus Limnocylindrales bacterium]|nr:SPFH domain-containing protein [Candidatus Limnocylindrales bacterium]
MPAALQVLSSLVPPIAVGLVVGLLAAIAVYATRSVRYISNHRVGVVEKLWSRSGSVPSGLIALRGEAGFQPDVLRGGLHVFRPFQYRIHSVPLVTIPQGQIGYVFARDGVPLPPTQTLARTPDGVDFGDVRAFLVNGGQRGPQRRILREGTYAINLAQFVVITANGVYGLALERTDQVLLDEMTTEIAARQGFEPVVISGHDDQIGVVTVHDGPSLMPGEIIAPTVGDDPADDATYHNTFQEPERFLTAGGRRGRQLQVIVEGTYYLNRLFATVELVAKAVVEVGTVGVVVSYTGDAGEDLSGDAYGHGELVDRGERGVWAAPLLPGKYAFNTYAGKIVMVPTTNFILKWNASETGAHKFDENLSEVDLITKDAFEPSLPLSVVVHIDYRKAPLVVQRFGDVKRLVEQTLDPMVSAYFKNIAQTRTLIELIHDRAEIQDVSSVEMRERFARYNLELQEVLIGTPTQGRGGAKLEEILTQLRSRQVALEQVETYSRQQEAAVKERELREAEARARQQASITESELSIAIQSNHGKADLARAQQQAAQIQALAGAEAEKTRLLGTGEAARVASLASAEAERAARVGIAEALAIEEQVRAYGGPRYQLTQQVMARFAEAVERSGVDIVPKVVIGGRSDGASAGGSGDGSGAGSLAGSTVLESLLALLLSERLGVDVAERGEPSPAALAVRAELQRRLTEGGEGRAA